MTRDDHSRKGAWDTARVCRLVDQGREDDLRGTASGQRLEMMWQLALDAWAFKGVVLTYSPRPSPRLPADEWLRASGRDGPAE